MRFPGFTDPWEQRKLEDIFTERHILSKITEEYPRLSFTIEEGVIHPEDRKTNKRDFLMKDESNKKFLVTELEDIIYNPANVVWGALHRNTYGKGCLSPIYKIFSTYENPAFIECILRSPSFIRALSQKTEGTVVKLKTLKPEAFLEMSISVAPQRAEQDAIAAVFEQIDNLITLHQRECDEMKNYKKGLLHQMFPQPGEAFPRVRFPGFTDPWEQRKLGNVVDVCSGKDYKHLDEGEIPVYGTGGYMLSVSEALSQHDAIGIGRKGTIDNPYILRAPFWTVDTLFYCVPKICDLYFVYALYHTINWRSMDESTGVPSLSKTAINDVDIHIPSVDEQHRIGELFSNLDETITLHQRKCDELKLYKKGLLQKMFV
ncbi:MAG: restriction endonuclease subunit S [Butyrivibrio sp.]|nr:restriction endonuclease subunit S [Butyrivibrio sp.]